MFRRVRMFIPLLCVLLALVPAHAAAPQFFPETQHNLIDPFASFWHTYGGLPVFGFPISEAFPELNADTGATYQTQYFERNRLEAHPENAAPYNILLGLLGKEALLRQGRDWTTFPKADPASPHFFADTQHAIAHEPFWAYFRAHGLEFDGKPGYSLAESIALFGLPLSEASIETNSSGDTVLTQWFERARFEFHPQNEPAFQVLLGLLGNEVTTGRGAEAPFQPATPQDEAHAAAQQLFGIFNERRQAEFGKPPVTYRADIQAEADAIAQEMYDTWIQGGDVDAVQERGSERLSQKNAFIAYTSFNVPLTAQCLGVDPITPIGSGYSPYVASLDYSSITFGVSSIHKSSCGPSITIMYIISY